MLKRDIDGKILTRSWYSETDISPVLHSLDLTLPGHKKEGVIENQQVFKIPDYAFRQTNMANIATDLSFFLQREHGGKCLYATENNLLAFGNKSTFPNTTSGIVNFTLPAPNSYHVGYHISIGGKWIQAGQPGQPISLVSDLAHASHLCPILSHDQYVALWLYDTDLILGLSQTQEQPQFFQLDSSKTAMSWFVESAEPHTHSSTGQRTRASDLPSSTYINSIVEKLNNRGFSSNQGTLWDYSFDNVLETNNWLLSTPGNMFKSYDRISQRIKDNNEHPLDLEKCDGLDTSTNTPCIPLRCSITSTDSTSPNGQAKAYRAGHSYFLYEEIYKVITSADHIVDICTLLGAPGGEFKGAIRNAISYLATKPSAENVIIRLLMGKPIGKLANLPGSRFLSSPGPFPSAESVLKGLVDLEAIGATNSKMKIYLSYPGTATSWNHAKIVAADGKECIVGGHNMWDQDYLAENPTCDVSMKLSGHAAIDAQNYADDLWSRLNASTCSEAVSFDTINGFKNDSFPLLRVFKGVLDAAETTTAGRRSGSGIPVLSIGRTEIQNDGQAPADVAIIALVRQAKQSIYISAQTMSNALLWDSWWPDEFLQALADALEKNVEVHLFLSNPDAGDYHGDPPAIVEFHIANLMNNLKSNDKLLRLRSKLKIHSFPTSSEKWGLLNSKGVKNHAKVILVDNAAFSIGSQNFYPTMQSSLSEFTYLVEDTTSATKLFTDYFNPLSNWANPALNPPLMSIPHRYSYEVTLLKLHCINVSGDGNPIFRPGADDAYLSLNKKSNIFFPEHSSWSSATYKKIDNDQELDVNFTIPAFTTNDNPQVVQLYDKDYIKDDLLLDWVFHPEHSIAGKKLKDLDPGITHLAVQTQSYDPYVYYKIAFSFTRKDLLNSDPGG